jgi:hypothetical protein
LVDNDLLAKAIHGGKDYGYGLRVSGRDNLVDRNVSAKPN